jgi:hypothetical protein
VSIGPLADVAWWAPLAIIGGAIFGAVVGYLLLVVVGGARRPAKASSTDYERTDKTNYATWNPVAFLVIGAVIALIVGLAVGL